MDKREKIRKMKVWFTAYSELFNRYKSEATDEQILVYNEMARILDEPEYVKPKTKLVKVKISETEYVMREVMDK